MKRYVSMRSLYPVILTMSEQKLSSLLETLYATATSPSPLINSGVLSQSTDQFASLWSLREGIPEAAGKTGKVYKYDISVPVREFMNVTNLVRNRLQERGLYRCGPSSQVSYVMGYGHVGDGTSALSCCQRRDLIVSLHNRESSYQCRCERIQPRNRESAGALCF